jgi:hypothetical protein
MANRQPCLTLLERHSPLPPVVKATADWQHWQQLEQTLQHHMLDLNTQQVELEQVFAQIQSARQQLAAYHIAHDGDPAEGTVSAYNLNG